MKRIAGTLTAAAALAVMATSAQAAIVYEKGGKIYAASNSGKNSKLLVSGGRWPEISPNGQTVLYGDASRALFAVPLAGGTPVKLSGTDCSACAADFAPDGTWFAYTDSKGNLTRVPLDGGPAIQLATGVFSRGAVSPDGSQIAFDRETADSVQLFTVPSTGGTSSLLLQLPYGLFPIWTPSGIVTTTVGASSDDKPQTQIARIDAIGNVKRVLAFRTFPNLKKLTKALPYPVVAEVAGANIVTFDLHGKKGTKLQLVGSASGTVKATRTFAAGTAALNVSANGKTILTIKNGKLQSVSFKTGKRTTLIKTGVKSASIN